MSHIFGAKDENILLQPKRKVSVLIAEGINYF